MKLTISPSWVRWVLIIVSGGLAALAALSLVSILLSSGTPGLFPFATQLVAFLLYASGSLSLLSGLFGLLSVLSAPSAQPVGAYMQPISMLGISVATFLGGHLVCQGQSGTSRIGATAPEGDPPSAPGASTTSPAILARRVIPDWPYTLALPPRVLFLEAAMCQNRVAVELYL